MRTLRQENQNKLFTWTLKNIPIKLRYRFTGRRPNNSETKHISYIIVNQIIMRQIIVIKTVHFIVNKMIEKFKIDKKLPISYLHLLNIECDHCFKNKVKSRKSFFVSLFIVQFSIRAFSS